MKWTPRDCAKGDMVRIQTGSVFHYGIFVSEDEVIQFGYPPLPEYADKNDPPLVCAVDIDTFSSGRVVQCLDLSRAERKKRLPVEQTVKTARSRLGEGGYNLLHNNCEHFANECYFGVKRSEQEETMRKKWQSRTTLDVYFTDLSKNSEKDMLEYAARRSGGLDIYRDMNVSSGSFTYEADGKWVCISTDKTARCAAVAVSNKPVGIGVAQYGSPDENTLKKLICGLFERAEGRELYRLYSRKKSAAGGRRLKSVKTSKPGIRTFDTPEELGCVISVCSEAEELRVFSYENGAASISDRI